MLYYLTAVPWELQGVSVRVLGALWLLVALVLSSVYRSNLKAMLILPRVTIPFDNLEELVQKGIPTNVYAGTRLHRDILNAPVNSTLGKLRDQIETITDGREMITKTLMGTHVAMGPRTSYEWALHDLFSLRGTCLMHNMKGNVIQSTWYSLGFPRGSPLREKVNTIIRRVKYAGIWNHLYRTSVVNATECLRPLESGFTSTNQRSMTFTDFAGVFCVYLAGALVSALVFLMEMLVARLG
ncbi:uncharacterized protein LOC119573155 isoform X2 [Penaeus monodon]|uniref:uncharacterized protein LOC119573155 isoform X2 n=1 Tax=Penaeus monodon TaxID=6687 RepID=UPI0018A75626|nr:uncharacterized protein LOC119573155 isoform X2 [Penaeus monodon]